MRDPDEELRDFLTAADHDSTMADWSTQDEDDE